MRKITAILCLGTLLTAPVMSGEPVGFAGMDLTIVKDKSWGDGHARLVFRKGRRSTSVDIREYPIEKLISGNNRFLVLPIWRKGGVVIISNETTLDDIKASRWKHWFTFFGRERIDRSRTYIVGASFGEWKNDKLMLWAYDAVEDSSPKVYIEFPDAAAVIVSEPYLKNYLVVKDFNAFMPLRTEAEVK